VKIVAAVQCILKPKRKMKIEKKRRVCNKIIEVASNTAITNGHAPVLQVVRVFYTWRSNHSLQAIRQHIEKS